MVPGKRRASYEISQGEEKNDANDKKMSESSEDLPSTATMSRDTKHMGEWYAGSDEKRDQ